MSVLSVIENSVYNAVRDIDYEDVESMKDSCVERLEELDIKIAVLTDFLISANDRLEIKRIKGRISEACGTREMLLAKMRALNTVLEDMDIRMVRGHGIGKAIPEKVAGYV
jgi:hypothetical protein